jgi:hypothetical protein
MKCFHAWINDPKAPLPHRGGFRLPITQLTRPALFLPGAFFVAIGAQLFAPFMFINFAFATFF